MKAVTSRGCPITHFLWLVIVLVLPEAVLQPTQQR
jgi:hypothetical protein